MTRGRRQRAGGALGFGVEKEEEHEQGEEGQGGKLKDVECITGKTTEDVGIEI